MGIGEKNVGTTDKLVRIMVGLAFLYVYYMGYLAAPLSYILVLLAIAMFATAAFSTCYLYTLLGMDTVEKAGKKKKK